MALRKSAALEQQGRLGEAIEQLEGVARGAGEGHPNAALARERIRQLQAKFGRSAAPGTSRGEDEG